MATIWLRITCRHKAALCTCVTIKVRDPVARPPTTISQARLRSLSSQLTAPLPRRHAPTANRLGRIACLRYSTMASAGQESAAAERLMRLFRAAVSGGSHAVSSGCRESG
jgi:hypothetical protein